MDRNQKIILLLLVVAILFSVASIVVTFSASRIDLSWDRFKPDGGGNGRGTVGFVVEGNSVPSGVENG